MKKTNVVINPPPSDGKCECCGEKTDLVKDFREENEVISPYWVCKTCLVLNDKAFFKRVRKR